jgi:hypothetical protein
MKIYKYLLVFILIFTTLNGFETTRNNNVKISSIEIVAENDKLKHNITIENVGVTLYVDALLSIYTFNEVNENKIFLQEYELTIFDIENIIFNCDYPYFKGYTYFYYNLLFDDEIKQYNRSFLYQNPPIVINEIMPNPLSGEPKWVELFKLRDTINTKDIKMIIGNTTININNFTTDYVLITTTNNDIIYLREKYNLDEEIAIYRGLQSLNIAGNTIYLKDNEDNLLEVLSYTSAFSIKGVSTERISPTLPPNASNWLPSKTISTPGRQNSVFLDFKQNDNKINIQNERFSPYKNEVCLISIKSDELNIKADVIIYDLKGRKIVSLADDSVISGNYTFIWNGKNADKQNVFPAAYTVYLNLKSLNGNKIFSTQKLVYVGY